MKDTEKLIFLRLIKQHRHKLVGRFSSGVSDADKKNTWTSIIEICRNQHGFELIPEGKDWKYVRDHSWPNIRNYSTQKIDSQKKTGAAGGKARLMTAVDDMVLDIIGKESPIMSGIGNNLETACGELEAADYRPPNSFDYGEQNVVVVNEAFDDSMLALQNLYWAPEYSQLQPRPVTKLISQATDQMVGGVSVNNTPSSAVQPGSIINNTLSTSARASKY